MKSINTYILFLWVLVLTPGAGFAYAYGTAESEMINEEIQKTITDVVTDKKGQTLPGVNIVEKGTSNGTFSDVDGNYSIVVASSNSILVFSYIGYQSRELYVGNQTTVNVTLVENNFDLVEVKAGSSFFSAFFSLIYSFIIAILMGILLKRFDVQFKKWVIYSFVGLLIATTITVLGNLLQREIGYSFVVVLIIALLAGFFVGYAQAKVLKDRFTKTKYWIIAVTIVYASSPLLDYSGIYNSHLARSIIYVWMPFLVAIYLGVTILVSMRLKTQAEDTL